MIQQHLNTMKTEYILHVDMREISFGDGGKPSSVALHGAEERSNKNDR